MKPSPDINTRDTCTSCGEFIPESLSDDAFCTRCRYHDAPKSLQWDAEFDNYGRALPPHFDDLTSSAPSEETSENEQSEQTGFSYKLAGFVAWLIQGASVEQAGRKAFLVAHLGGKSGCRDDAELAKKLGITKARISQLRRELAPVLGRLSRCNKRQI